MSISNQANSPNTTIKEHRHDLEVRFLAELVEITGTPANQEDFQAALQAFCDGLRPWLESSDGRLHPRAVFSLLEDYRMDASGELMMVVFSQVG
jgi:hypothetical protein